MLIKLFFELPVKGLLSIAERINEQYEQATDEEKDIRKKLVELYLLYEMDEIEEVEYQEQESMLLARLKTLKQEDRHNENPANIDKRDD